MEFSGIELNAEVNLGQLIFDKRANKASNGERSIFSTNDAGTIGYSQLK